MTRRDWQRVSATEWRHGDWSARSVRERGYTRWLLARGAVVRRFMTLQDCASFVAQQEAAA